jgi:hypothetical protein
VVWNVAARAQRSSRLRRRDLDSEGENERRCSEGRLRSQLTDGGRVSWRSRELETGDHDDVSRVGTGDFSLSVLTDECRCHR